MRLELVCPAPPWTVRVVVPVVGVSLWTRKLMLDSSLLVVVFHLMTAFGLMSPLKKTRDMSCPSEVALSVLMVKSLLVVPEIEEDAPEMVFALMLST